MARPAVNDINFFTTYQCNSRCTNCQIWKGRLAPPSRRELTDDDLEKLFDDPLFQECSGVGLAGGEPTIAPFAWRLLERLPPEKRVTVTTNALNSARLVAFLKECGDRQRYTVQVSLDGIGPLNDQLRGVPGAFDKTVALLANLQELGVRRLLSFTINRANFRQVGECFELACRYGAQFSTRMAYAGGAYANEENRQQFRFGPDELDLLDRELGAIISREMARPDHYPAKLVFLKKITAYYRGEQKDLPCQAMQSGMVIDLYGNVFPNCPVMMQPVGNLHEAGLAEIWESEKARAMRSAIARFACGGCWNDCQVITNIARAGEFLEKEYGALKIAALGENFELDAAALDFNRGDSSLLLSGWHGLEGDDRFRYRWTEQEFSLLVPEGFSSLDLFATFPEKIAKEALTLELFTNGERVAQRVVRGEGWQNYRFSLPTSAERVTIARFHLSRYYCPRESGDGDDVRRLGAAINRITFS